jgi:hypothetical protein
MRQATRDSKAIARKRHPVPPPIPTTEPARPAIDPTEALRVYRRTLEAAVGRLIAVIDKLDPDPDLEPSCGYIPPGGAAT